MKASEKYPRHFYLHRPDSGTENENPAWVNESDSKAGRALINQIDAGLSVKKLSLNISSTAELLFYLEFAASALKKAAPRPRKRE